MSDTGVADQVAPSTPSARPRSNNDPARGRLPSVRVLITLIVVLPIAAVSVALVAIATLTNRSVAEQLGDEIVARAQTGVTSDVHAYLGSAMRLSELYTQRIQDGSLPTRGLEAWERAMFQDLAVHPDVASICFANVDGDCTWLLRAHGRLELGLVRGNARDRATEWPVDVFGDVDRANPIRVYHYDAAQRPWYQIALERSAPIWTPIYFWFPDQRDASVTGTGYTRAIRDRSGQIVGVLIIDVTLSALSEHLRQMPITRSGYAYIVDEQGLLIAASDGPVNSTDGKRLSPAQSPSAAARAIADLVSVNAHGPQIDAPQVETMRVYVSDEPAVAQVSEIKPFTGIHWHIVTVLPESSFLFKATSLRHRSIMLAGWAIIGGLLLGLLLSRRLSLPLLRLSEHVVRVGGGDFDSRLNLQTASELRRLSDEVNRMASGLKHRMMLEQSMAVAEQIQQSLLPSALPVLKGLEIGACSKYCESTGGDYYDFIEVPGFEGNRTLIAVGDVTGHGLGAALLMASARGAVRASCDGAASLGHILTRANNTLISSAHQGMFMTLSLVFVNPDTRYIHWASAGHDPVIVYHPDSDSFEELPSGDMPLGIDLDVAYREFSRPCAVPGTLILVGTDGIWEARNADGEMFGKDRLRQIMRDNPSSAEAVADGIRRAMYGWVGPAPLQDDVTFVVIRVC